MQSWRGGARTEKIHSCEQFAHSKEPWSLGRKAWLCFPISEGHIEVGVDLDLLQPIFQEFREPEKASHQHHQFKQRPTHNYAHRYSSEGAFTATLINTSFVPILCVEPVHFPSWD